MEMAGIYLVSVHMAPHWICLRSVPSSTDTTKLGVGELNDVYQGRFRVVSEKVVIYMIAVCISVVCMRRSGVQIFFPKIDKSLLVISIRKLILTTNIQLMQGAYYRAVVGMNCS